MFQHFHCNEYKVRAGVGRALELTLPPTLGDDGILRKGDMVKVLYSHDFIVILPPKQELDLQRLSLALELARP